MSLLGNSGAKFPSVAALIDADERGELDDTRFDDALWLLLCDRIGGPEDASRFPEPVRAYFASRYIMWEVGNGGFAQAAYNIPDWFELAAWGYEQLGLAEASALIRRAIALLPTENRRTTFTARHIGRLFQQFKGSRLARLDDQLDEVGFWADKERLAFVRAHREAFRSVD